ncbi:ADP-ribose pyrophosphatase YjhB, NUDIX family [Raineyella antarctica]|uniref:ADP-ribose pyrophosphatase YjhB, NUDIX family n=1 Tax=Raineyella antarctica TaxID=1577474 RepID=A0A1G6HEC5_9ACTN|nr:NUDIX hydrolase [Raineyella antarctica]SDB92610.1 ADP-ribose pyrophosphatase YjhB, NUDIX family [Raineyella antarctica]
MSQSPDESGQQQGDPFAGLIPQEIPVSAGAILLDPRDRLLVLKPTYKSGWTIPGGIMEADGESPWEACRREVLEETGLHVEGGRLVCVDTRPAREGRKLGLRFLFHCGQLRPEQVADIVIDPLEIEDFRFAPLEEALQLLRKPVRRRVRRGIRARRCVYLENGRPVTGVN